MNWFAKNGDKVLTFITLAMGVITANAAKLGLDGTTVAWLTTIPALGALAHTIFFPNDPTPKETPK